MDSEHLAHSEIVTEIEGLGKEVRQNGVTLYWGLDGIHVEILL